MRAKKLTRKTVKKFCAALAETGIVSRACEQADVSREIAYRWKKNHPEFEALWEEALQIGITRLEDEAHRRAFEGVEVPLMYQGVEVGSVKEYSDTLAIFLLKAHRPDKYRERSEVSVTGDIRVTEALMAARGRLGRSD